MTVDPRKPDMPAVTFEARDGIARILLNRPRP